MNYLKGCLYGFVALVIGFVVAYFSLINFVWHRPGEKNVGVDIVSVVVGYSSVPEVWLAALLLFALGFYLGLRKKLSR
jgi:ABC-type dipeptide/oligopeptide/nickel transport system permease component